MRAFSIWVRPPAAGARSEPPNAWAPVATSWPSTFSKWSLGRRADIHADLTDPDIPAQLKEALGGPADVVLSDMAASTTGHRATDHIRTITLLEIALDLAEDVLKPGGVLIGKAFQGGASGELLAASKSFSTTSNTSNRRLPRGIGRVVSRRAGI